MRNPSRAPLLAETAAREKLPIRVSQLDVDSDDSVTYGIGAIIQEAGAIDVLVNNAGVEGRGAVEEIPLAKFREIMETNYFGAIRCIQALVPQMRERRSGCIINVSSVAGRLSCPPMTSYSASKWALEALSEGLAGEMKTFNVRVAIVEPGIIDTSMARRLEEPANQSLYGQSARFSALFNGALQQSVPPSVVADKILEIAKSGTWQLRHPVGPDALPFIQWRNGMTDEAWVEMNGGDDAAFFSKLSESSGK
jgi:NAD(P)-dependent dehydrogenase (short-subunit alcohol dehydrogenase family)